MGAFFTPFFPEDFRNPSPLQFDRFGLRAKKPHTSCDPQKWIFTYFLFSRRRKARSKARNRGQKWYRKRHPKCNKKSPFLSIVHLSGRNAQKTSKNDLPEPLRGPPQGGERRSETGLRGAKRTPRRSQEPSIQFSNCPFLAQNALLRPTWRPRRFRRSPEARLGLPTTRNWTPGGVEFDPRGLLFWTRGRRFLQPVGLLLGPTGVDFHDPLRRWWGHTVTAFFSRPSPAVCAKRLNNIFYRKIVYRNCVFLKLFIVF